MPTQLDIFGNVVAPPPPPTPPKRAPEQNTRNVGRGNAEFIGHLVRVREGSMTLEQVRENVRQRKYRDLNKAALPEWVRLAGVS